MITLFPYTASYVRARVLRTFLLTISDWNQLLLFNNSNEVFQYLVQKKIISSKASSIEECQKELRENFIRTTEKLFRFCSGEHGDFLRYFIYYFDVLNVEAIIAYLNENPGESNNSLENLCNTGQRGLLHPKELHMLTNFAVLEEALKKTILYQPFISALTLFKTNDNVSQFISSFEWAFMKKWKDKIKSNNSDFRPGSIVDTFFTIKSINALLRIKFYRNEDLHNIPPMLHDILDSKQYRQAFEKEDITKAFKELVSILVPSKDLSLQPGTSSKQGLIDLQLKHILFNSAQKSQAMGIPGRQFLFGFLFLKIIELENITALLECKELGLETGETQQYIVGLE